MSSSTDYDYHFEKFRFRIQNCPTKWNVISPVENNENVLSEYTWISWLKTKWDYNCKSWESESFTGTEEIIFHTKKKKTFYCKCMYYFHLTGDLYCWRKRQLVPEDELWLIAITAYLLTACAAAKAWNSSRLESDKALLNLLHRNSKHTCRVM